MMQIAANTVDSAEVAKFEAMAAEWWNPEGKFKPLHMLNPCRLDYITAQIAAEFDRDLTEPNPFSGLRLLDIGCRGAGRGGRDVRRDPEHGGDRACRRSAGIP
jgi:2-polyprenyl-6-hydroxyphenyl methylase/3-demethylubiquinone-9 3-methyltransferase